MPEASGPGVDEILDEAESIVFRISDKPSRGGPEAVNHYRKLRSRKIDDLLRQIRKSYIDQFKKPIR